MIKEFRDFIQKGNVLDMAIGVIIGAAFKAIVDSLVEDLLTPLLSAFTAGVDFKDWVVSVGNINFALGNFINNIISFLIIAFVMFLIVKAFNKFKKKEEVAAPNTKTCPHCMESVNIEATKCPHCTSVLN
ncbi:MAG: large conductance mechanosensitive channel protein MscL [Helcococcus sp.]|nr:large conductance mechanosensitive channel protein MscL [Helcococcus sp.]